MKISKFARAYLECMLWSSTDESREDGGDPLDRNYSIEDIDPASLALACVEADAFALAHAEDLVEWSSEQAGHDLWLTQNGHGTGYWDRDLADKATRERLTDAAHALGGRYAYVGDPDEDGIRTVYLDGYPRGDS